MKEEQKVYIKGVPGRGKEVIKALTKLGGGKGGFLMVKMMTVCTSLIIQEK